MNQQDELFTTPFWKMLNALVGGGGPAPRDAADELEDRDQNEPHVSEECERGEHPSCEDDECSCRCHEPDEEE
jgi:hypothetical protein